MKYTITILAMIFATPAFAEDLIVTPRGDGGWTIDGPPSLNHGATIDVIPRGDGGYNAERIGAPTITIIPRGDGGYNIDSGSVPIDPSLLNAIIPPR